MIIVSLATWALSEPSKPADQLLRQSLNDSSLKASKKAELLQISIMQNDVIFWAESAGQVLCCLFGDETGMLLHMRPLQLIKRASWGSAWKQIQAETFCLRMRVSHQIHRPTWVREDSNCVICLHWQMQCLNSMKKKVRANNTQHVKKRKKQKNAYLWPSYNILINTP